MKFRELFLSGIAVSVSLATVTAEASKGIPKNLNVRTTAYTHSEADHLQYGRKTAAGGQLKSGKSYTSAAADWSRFPLGTKFKIKGIDSTFVVDDYGRALVGTETIDLYHPSRGSMNRWGVRNVNIEILEFGDYEKSREILKQRTSYAHVRRMLAHIPKEQPPGLLDRMMAGNDPKPAPESKSPPASAPRLAPKPSALASAPVVAPRPVFVAATPPKPATAAPPRTVEPRPEDRLLAWEESRPKSVPAPAAASDPVPAPRVEPAKTKARKFVPLELASLERPPSPEINREQPKPAVNNRERQFRPLPASWRPDA